MSTVMTYIETAEDYAIRPLPVTGGRREACTPADALCPQHRPARPRTEREFR